MLDRNYCDKKPRIINDVKIMKIMKKFRSIR